MRYFKGDIYTEYLVGSGILRRNQLDDTHDGSPVKFFQSRGRITQSGFATSEPYRCRHDPGWGRKVKYALVNDTGYPFYPTPCRPGPPTRTNKPAPACAGWSRSSSGSRSTS